MNRIIQFYKNQKGSFSRASFNVFLLLVLLIALRGLEYLELVYFGFLKDADVAYTFSRSANYDMVYIGVLFFIIFLPLIMLRILSKKTLFWFLNSVLFLVFISHVLLTGYYLTNHELLGEILFSYSFSELLHIVSSELKSPKWGELLGLISLISIAFYVFILRKKSRQELHFKHDWSIQIVGLFFLILGFFQLDYMNPIGHDYKTVNEYNLAYNKNSFLITSFLEAREANSIDEEELKKSTIFFQSTLKQKKFTSTEYPFLRTFEPNNVLKDFINLKEDKPNIVLLICESLSRSFSGPDAYYSGFTPFLDSLSNHSLYWKNTVSNCHRTYGALPNILCSAPLGNSRGFINNPGFIPKNHSAMKMLAKEGYSTSFLYGGNSYFDNMKFFMTQQNVGTLLDQRTFDKKHGEISGEWGYNDSLLFEQVHSLLDKNTFKEPYFNVILTVSLHGPYDHPTDYYYQKVDSVSKKLNKKKQTTIEKHKKAFKTMLYTDAMLKNFFDNYKIRADFNNTIFVIVGDHNIHYMPLRSPIEEYHVPLYIYSPLLSKGQTFPNIASHQDIFPSLWALLDEKYSFSTPNEISWSGTGLQTDSTVNNNCFIPLNTITTKVQGIYGDKAIINGTVYPIDMNTFSLEKEPAVDTTFSKLMNSYFSINNYVCRRNKLIK